MSRLIIRFNIRFIEFRKSLEYMSRRECVMVSYKPLWKTMEEKGATTYTLQVKGGVSSSTIRRIKANESVSTTSLEAICKILECEVQDVIEFLPD